MLAAAAALLNMGLTKNNFHMLQTAQICPNKVDLNWPDFALNLLEFVTAKISTGTGRTTKTNPSWKPKV